MCIDWGLQAQKQHARAYTRARRGGILKGYNLDYELTPKQKADARAFSVLVEEDLHLSLVRWFAGPHPARCARKAHAIATRWGCADAGLRLRPTAPQLVG